MTGAYAADEPPELELLEPEPPELELLEPEPLDEEPLEPDPPDLGLLEPEPREPLDEELLEPDAPDEELFADSVFLLDPILAESAEPAVDPDLSDPPELLDPPSEDDDDEAPASEPVLVASVPLLEADAALGSLPRESLR